MPVWSSFLGGLLQGPYARRLMAFEFGRVLHPEWSRDECAERIDTLIARVGNLVRGTLPTADTGWKIAAALRNIGQDFCAGPVVLYASANLEAFVRTMIFCDVDLSKREFALRYIDTVVAEAASPIVPEADFPEFVPFRLHRTTRDASVMAAREEWFEELHGYETAELFDAGWERANSDAVLPDDPDVDAAVIAAASKAAPLARRKRATVLALRRYFRRLMYRNEVEQGLRPPGEAGLSTPNDATHEYDFLVDFLL